MVHPGAAATRNAGGAGPPAEVGVDELRVGDLLAEGGEGRVHLLPRMPHLVLKLYRRPADAGQLARLVAWPGQLPPAGEQEVRASSSWPVSVVVGRAGEGLGLLVPRAPRRFSVRHRDGHSRLASLSYLTADPDHRAAAYGLSLPAEGGPERVGIVHALARLLAAFDTGELGAGHGDLSTKNVLWSLQRGPEVFVLDCDSAALFGPDGQPAGADGRRRAMTPNWDDPAVPPGHNPTAATDRYSLALIFLRVVGAANFPVQARQRSGDRLEIRFPVPPGPGSELLLDPGAPLWALCGRALSLDGDRPAAAEWLRPLETLLAAMGVAVPRPAGTVPVPAAAEGGPVERGVLVIPERAAARPRTWTRVSPAPRYGAAVRPGPPPAAYGYRFVTLSNPRRQQPNPASAQPRPPGGAAPTWVRPSTLNQPWNQPASPGSLAAPPGGAPGSAPPNPWLSAGASTPIWPELREQLVRFAGWWLGLHTVLWAVLTGRRRQRRWRAALLCLTVDFAITVLAGASVALIVSPLIQS